MKRALRGVLVLVVAGIATQVGTAAPAVNLLKATPDSVVFWNARDGLLGVGLCAATQYACGFGAVELTTDGGRTYRVVLRTRRPIEQVQTVGSRGAIVRTFGLQRFRTLDRGHSWKPWRGRTTVSFATPRVGLSFSGGFVRGTYRMRLLVTHDGGRSWSRAGTPCMSEGPLLDLVTPRLGWILCGGQPGAGLEQKAVFRTRDGGRTWRELAYTRMTSGPGDRGGISGLGYPAGISFAPDGFGLMWESRGTLYVTRDGGANWRPKPGLAVFDLDFGRGASAFDNGTGFVLLGKGGGLPARLIETSDFGRRWRVVHRWHG